MDCILLAAGEGKRMDLDIPKQFFRIKGKPLFIYSLERLSVVDEINTIYLTCNENFMEEYVKYIEQYDFKKNIVCIEGGKTRQESVFKALLQVKTEYVIIHESARPLIDRNLIMKLIQEKNEADAIVPTVPIKFTVAVGDEFMKAELKRSQLHNVQLPQIFKKDKIYDAHVKSKEDGYTVTEDSMMIFHYGGKVKFIPGLESNIKITSNLDLIMIERLLFTEE